MKMTMNDYGKFQDLLDCCLAEALENAFLPDAEVIFKSLCRTYSTKFHTPLHTVYTLDPKEVIQAVLEERYVGSDIISNLEDMLEQVYTLEDPEYKKQKEVDMDSFVKAAEAKEQERIRKNNELKKERPKEEVKKGGFDASKLNINNEG